MNQAEVEQKSYQMPPQDGFTVAHFLTVADIERSARFYQTVFGGRILSRGDSRGAPGYLQIANAWLIVNVVGGPTPDKPSVTLGVPADPDSVSSFMNIWVADIQAGYELWRKRGAEFITEPKDNYGETRCHIRDPDGYIIGKASRALLTAERLKLSCALPASNFVTNRQPDHPCDGRTRLYRSRASAGCPCSPEQAARRGSIGNRRQRLRRPRPHCAPCRRAPCRPVHKGSNSSSNRFGTWA